MSLSSAALPIDTLVLPTAPETGTPPRRRVKSAAKAYELYSRLRRADLTSAGNRIAIQSMFDGAPPFDDEFLKRTGQAPRCNLNWGEGEELLEKAISAYVDIESSVEDLISVQTKYRFENPSEKTRAEQIIASEWSKMVRRNPAYYHRFLYTCHNFLAHGVGITYFGDERNWMWESAAWGDFVIPRRTLATQDALEVAYAVKPYQPHELFRHIENEEMATAAGWNVPATRKAIANPSAGQVYSPHDWEKLQVDLKDNDLFYGSAHSEIKLLHMWVVEFNGKVSHYIFPDNHGAHTDAEERDFLYKKEDRYDSLEQAFTFFTYGIGTNGHFHSIRGLGHKIFPMVQFNNQLLSQMADGARLSASVMIQPESEEAMDGLQLVHYGPYSLVSPGFKFIERAAPNLTTAVDPALNRLGMMIQRRAGAYTQDVFGDNGGGGRTKFEMAAQLDHLAKLSITSLNLFYQPWERLLRESFRRSIRKNYVPIEPGGVEVAEFVRRCFEQGVPKEAIYQCDVATVKAVRAVGAGSAAARQLVFNELTEMSPQFDDQGRRQVLRERVASRVGWQQVDKFVSPDNAPRPTSDDRFAILESAMMSKGTPLPVLPNDNHAVHARIQIGDLTNDVQAIQNGQAQIEDLVPNMVIKHEHVSQHVEAMASDQVLAEEAAAYRQMLQQVGEEIYNGVKHLQKVQRAAQDQGQPVDAGEVEHSKALERQILESNVKLKAIWDKAQLDMQVRAAKAAQERAIRDANAAADLRIKAFSAQV